MNWRYALAPGAAKTLRKLDRTVQKRILAALDLLITEMDAHHRPVRSDVAKLRGQEGRYRLKIPDWRVIFRFESGVLLILVLEIGNRGEIY